MKFSELLNTFEDNNCNSNKSPLLIVLLEVNHEPPLILNEALELLDKILIGVTLSIPLIVMLLEINKSLIF